MGQIFNPVAPALGVNRLLFSLIGANMNVTTDQALVAAFGFTNYLIDRIIGLNASTSLTLAAAIVSFANTLRNLSSTCP